MPNIPAICGSCGLVFPSGFVIENTAAASMRGVRSQCPRCGSPANIPDGIYSALGKVVEFLARPSGSLEQVRELRASLETAKAKEHATEEVRQAILEAAPELTSLAAALPANRVELYAFITVVLTLLALLVSAYAALKPSGPSQAEIDAMVTKAIEQATPSAPSGTSKPTPQIKPPKPGRNAPCPCGSGRKYKKCCLQAEA